MNTARTTGIHWTRFPADSLTDAQRLPLDWSDHQTAHRAICRLFPSHLPGESDVRRAESGILYRIDADNGALTVFIQSLTAPELVPTGQRTLEVPAQAWDLAEGTRVAFRIAVNPVRRTTRHFTDSTKTTPTAWSNQAGNQSAPRLKRARKQTARVVPADDMADWLHAKLGTALGGLEIVDHRRDKTGSGRHRIVVDTIDGIASVRDINELDRIRREGVGRSKAYGCGLLTVARLAEPR